MIVIRAIVKLAIYLFFKIVYRVKVIGTENIPKDKTKPLIYCGNHRSYSDPPLMVVTAKRHVRFLAKEELRKNPFFAFLGVVFGGIYVKRDSKDVTALKTTLKALKNGESIALFPEGTRNGVEKGQKAKDGAAFFAVKTGAQVIPVGISGGEKPFKKMYIKYGKPLDYSNRNKEELDEITEEIMKKILELANS
ncbi:MAG: 1-acyl-sn-glycerol-3-phosphate acyltransferase [Clostridia bacterium]|nr:1-acyl-sn-glycerol-3-phosphate acyltransferase [Clostridia bacterium]